MVTSLKAGPSFYLNEYTIIQSSGETAEPVHTADAASVAVDVVTDGKETASMIPTDLKTTKGTRQQIGPGAEGEQETVIYVEPIVDGVTPTALGFKRLEQTVTELQQRFQALEELSTNPELVERLKGKITDPLTDVWQIISITKRLDASEQGIDKLTTMVQDILKGDKQIVAAGDTSEFETRITNLETALDAMDNTLKNLQVIASGADGEEESRDTSSPKDDAQQPSQRISLSQLLGGINITEMHETLVSLKKEVSNIHADLNAIKETISQAPTETTTQAQQEAADTQLEVAEEGTPAHPETPTQPKTSPKHAAQDKPEETTPKQKEAQAETRPDSEAPTDINERLTKLEKDVQCLKEKIDSAPMAGIGRSAELDELVAKIQGIQSEMQKLNQTADRLIDDRENREIHLTALLEQVELLKTIKADREDLEDALADKADAQAINRKVSYDQFDAACDDLAQGLEDAISKLGKQESIWQQALDEVQKEIEGKVDKIEITPLKDFVSTRLKSLQEKLKNVAKMRQEEEAAGTKKMLRDVQCISCDKNVVMKMEDINKLKMEPLPCTVSMKPYLTYELDQVRKQHKRLPHSRNMIQFEAALQEEARKQKSARSDTLVKTPRDHLCNRYCGGSHTVTTPQQRVMRMGHFLTQWGPEIVQLTEGTIKGTDGKMYKSRPMPGKFDVCGPTYCENGSGEAQPTKEKSQEGSART
ncbi:uncharacterized protein LOC143188783 [Calliopsis andreniformis]|uniref:uncharacterized protein LOC143188783 n=1 Tax=Calliopsis andreniformis TaxID=337506 RepID=UPI003FCCDC21